MNFARPGLLGLALVLPILVTLAIVLWTRRRRRVARSFGGHLVARIGGAGLMNFPRARLALLLPCAALLGVAAAGPRWGLSEQGIQSRALDIVIAIDISKSMLVDDVSPNRLEQARLLARRLLRELPADRIGLVVFAGRAYVLSPLTVDHSALDLYIDALDPAIVSQGGSSLAAALAQSTDLARGRVETGGDRVVVFITDGEALEEQVAVDDAAARAARNGVRVYTVGVGTEPGAAVPDVESETGRLRGFKRDEDGNVVVSRMNGALLADIAQATGGEFYTLAAPGAAGQLIAELRSLERAQTADGAQNALNEQYVWFVGLALLLLALDAWLELRAGAAFRYRSGLALAAIVMLSFGFGVGDVERGNRLYREGRFAEAVEAYQRALADGESSPTLHYNLGTALLRLQQYAEAERHLQVALRDVDPDLRQRAYYNLGNRFLESAREGGDPRAQVQQLEAAVAAYRESLRLAPGDAEAKWNLEMALRARDEQQSNMSQPNQPQDPQDNEGEQEDESESQSSGGSSSQQPSSNDGETGSGTEQQPMSQQQAEQILAAIEQDERELTREKLKKGQRRTPVARDW